MKNPPDFPSHLPPLTSSKHGWRWVYRDRRYVSGRRIEAGHLAYMSDHHERWTVNYRAEYAEGGSFHYAELVPFESPEPDYASPHYRSWVEAGFAGGLRVQAKGRRWVDMETPNFTDGLQWRIHPEDADKEPDYSRKEYQRRVLMAALDGIPCEGRFYDGSEWRSKTMPGIAAYIPQSHQIRIAPPLLNPKPNKKRVPLGANDCPDVMWVSRHLWDNLCGNLVIAVEPIGVRILNGHISFSKLMDDDWLYSEDRKTWKPCWKEI